MPAPDLKPLAAVKIDRPLHVHLHADFVSSETLAGGVVVVIDNLRASVTMTAALFNGATCVVPTLTVEAALEARPSHPGCLLGGERGGVLIPGFDLDNSPRAYSRAEVAGRPVIFTTANGTAAIIKSRLAARVLIGSFVNLAAVCQAVAHDPRPVHLLCCGTREDVGLDDILPAGAMVEQLTRAGRAHVTNDSGRVALLAWSAVQSGKLADAMRESRGGRGLASLGLADDLSVCCAIDSMPILPELNAADGAIRIHA